MASLTRQQEEFKDGTVTLGDDNLYFETFIQMIGCKQQQIELCGKMTHFQNSSLSFPSFCALSV